MIYSPSGDCSVSHLELIECITLKELRTFFGYFRRHNFYFLLIKPDVIMKIERRLIIYQLIYISIIDIESK